jgi:hypothetical protein
VNREERIVELPSLLESHEDSLFLAAATLCNIANVGVILYDSEIAINTKKDTQKFLDGFLVGTYSGTPCKLDRSKKDLELGRAFAYALKLRGEMIKLGKLDLLAKNNFYFGNNPEEKVDKTPIPFGAKQKFIDVFEDPMFGNAMYSVFLYLFEEAGLSQFEEKDYNASFSRHTLRFDEVVSRFYQAVKVTKRGKTIVTGFRKGKKPNPSPLLTKGEYNLIMKIATPMWHDLDQFKDEWSSTVFSTAKSDKILDRLRRLYKSRFEFLQKFGSLTTKRLQEVRAFANNATLKKVDITLDMLVNTLKHRSSPGTQFLREVLKLFDSNKWALDEFELNNGIKEKSLTDYIIKEAMASYVEDQVFIVKVEDLPGVIPLEKDVIQCLSALKTILNRIRELSNRIGRCTSLYDVTLLERRFVPANIIIEHVIKGIPPLADNYKAEVIEFLLERFFQIKTSGVEFVTFLQKFYDQLLDIQKYAKGDWRTNREVLIDFSTRLTKVRAQLVLNQDLYVQPK